MNGQVVPRRSLRCLRPDELAASNASDIIKRAQFDEAVIAKIGN